MDNAMPMAEWANFIGSEYLDSFIKDGGASVKFAVMDEAQIPDLSVALAARARNADCLFAAINAVDARVHMPQDVFFAIAAQLDWRLLTRRVLLTLARKEGYLVDDIDASANGSIYAGIGEANQLDASSVISFLRPEIQRQIFMNRNMSRDFRVAMSHLCLAENSNHSDAYSAQALIDWLTGSNTRISNVRHFSVHTPINRTTARHYMESAFYWIRYAGYAGIAVFVDNTRAMISRRPQDGLRFYTRAMVLDHYELLRELIDSCDRLSGALVIVATNAEFLDEHTTSRGFGFYPALMSRVMDDVRDKNLVNPTAALVRLS